MAKSEILYSGTNTIVIRVNGDTYHKSVVNIIDEMVNEFGVSKTQDTIQALYDAGRIDQNTAGFLLDDLKHFAGKKQKARMVLL